MAYGDQTDFVYIVFLRPLGKQRASVAFTVFGFAGDAGKKLQCISRNRLQNEDKAPGKKQRIPEARPQTGLQSEWCKITVVTLQMQRGAVPAFGEHVG